MPIKRLQRGASFPRLGELRKGAPKPEKGNRPGRDLDHFRFTSNDPDARQKFVAIYGNEPQAVNVFLPYVTTAENWESWQEEWSAGGLVHRCDGEYVVLQQEQGVYTHPSSGAVPCPGNCSEVGRLKVIIPELARLAYVMVLTTSINDIIELEANLLAYEALRGSLQGIPFILSRVPRMVSTPGQNGKRVRREKWLLHLEAAPEWVQAQLSVMQRAALPSGQARYIDQGTGEIIEADYEDEPELSPELEAEYADGLGADIDEPAEDGSGPEREPDSQIADLRAKLEEKSTCTLQIVLDLAVATGLYDNFHHARTAAGKWPGWEKLPDGTEIKPGMALRCKTGLTLFDWLVDRKQDSGNRPLFDDQPELTGAYQD